MHRVAFTLIELLAGDFDEDCDVDWDDFAVFADNWLGENSL
jgi:hypothetical protein